MEDIVVVCVRGADHIAVAWCNAALCRIDHRKITSADRRSGNTDRIICLLPKCFTPKLINLIYTGRVAVAKCAVAECSRQSHKSRHNVEVFVQKPVHCNVKVHLPQSSRGVYSCVLQHRSCNFPLGAGVCANAREHGVHRPRCGHNVHKCADKQMRKVRPVRKYPCGKTCA
jgi:hypothetical protein